MKTDDKVYVTKNTPREESKTNAKVCLPPCFNLARSSRTLTSPPVHPNLAWTGQNSVQTAMKQVLHNNASNRKRRKNNWGTSQTRPGRVPAVDCWAHHDNQSDHLAWQMQRRRKRTTLSAAQMASIWSQRSDKFKFFTDHTQHPLRTKCEVRELPTGWSLLLQK